MPFEFLILCFFLIAFIYSMAGFGGGSSYIALLLIAGLASEHIRLIALICNIVVVFFATTHFQAKQLIPWKKLWPWLLLSIPFAFIGGKIQTSEEIYLIITGCTLLLVSVLLLLKKYILSYTKLPTQIQSVIPPIGGSLIGLLSGFIGIGGGIFLSYV